MSTRSPLAARFRRRPDQNPFCKEDVFVRLLHFAVLSRILTKADQVHHGSANNVGGPKSYSSSAAGLVNRTL